MMKEIIWVNGKLVKRKDAKVSIFDHGLLYGDGLFETMRAYKGRIFRLDEHIDRLFAGAKIVKIKIPYRQTFLKNNLSKLARTLKSNNAYVRIAVTRGEGRIGLNPLLCKKPNVILYLGAFSDYPESYYKRGIKTIISSTRCNNYSLLSNIKSNNYLNNILAFVEAKSKGRDDAIMLNADGFVVASTTGNIFMVKKDKLITPRVSEGLLPGITRAAIMELASNIDLKVVEKRLSIADLKDSEEIFLTNSIAGIRGVVKVDVTKISKGKVGPVTAHLHYLYQKLVRERLGV